jgi:hypothetical protein
MQDITSNIDTFNLICQYANNYYCFLVCKKWNSIIMANSKKCCTCNKIVQMYNNILWITDDESVEINGSENDYIYYDYDNWTNEDIHIGLPDGYHLHDDINPDIKTYRTDMCHQSYYSNLKDYKIMKQLLYKNYTYLRHIHRQCVSLCMYAIRQNKQAIIFVRNITDDICVKFCEMYDVDLDQIRNVIEDMCIQYVKKDINNLQYIHNQSEKLCMTVLDCKHYYIGNAIKYIRNQTDEICLKMIEMNGGCYGSCLKYINNQKEFICLEAIKYDAEELKYVKVKTEKLCLEALKLNSRVLKYIPDEWKTENMYLEAIKSNGLKAF